MEEIKINYKDKERVEMLAERIKLLFSFAYDLLQFKDILEEAVKHCGERESFALSAAPLLGAFGMDYEEKEFEAGLEGKRAKALLNLIEVLEETEKERLEFLEKQTRIAKGRDQLRKMFG